MRGATGIVKQRVISCHLRNPKFTAWQIAQEARCDSGYVRRVLGWKAPRRVQECPTPVLPPDTPALPHSADDVWTERKNAKACDKLLERLRQHHSLAEAA